MAHRRGRVPEYQCLECGRKFYTTRAAEAATFGDDGCPGCGGTDIDVYVDRGLEARISRQEGDRLIREELAIAREAGVE
jgi:DNA-directed RNA polymerase subunit RPC12/RpoP